jgi:hypothetical protein
MDCYWERAASSSFSRSYLRRNNSVSFLFSITIMGVGHGHNVYMEGPAEQCPATCQFCADHCIGLRALGHPAYLQQALRICFCPEHRPPGSRTESPDCIVPHLNFDGKPHLPAFVFDSERVRPLPCRVSCRTWRLRPCARRVRGRRSQVKSWCGTSTHAVSPQTSAPLLSGLPPRVRRLFDCLPHLTQHM